VDEAEVPYVQPADPFPEKRAKLDQGLRRLQQSAMEDRNERAAEFRRGAEYARLPAMRDAATALIGDMGIETED
jgi:hypothetical protein